MSTSTSTSSPSSPTTAQLVTFASTVSPTIPTSRDYRLQWRQYREANRNVNIGVEHLSPVPR